MTAVMGRAWGWVRSWGIQPRTQHTTTIIAKETKPSWSRGWTSWVWGGWTRQSDQSSPVEEFWEAPDKIQPMVIEELKAGKQETEVKTEPRWWNKLNPTYYIYWPMKGSGLRQMKQECEVDGDYSDYKTPPPSPTPPTASPFRLFISSWQLEILPEHDDICFNFLRHLFDLFVVGFLWTVSTPAKIVLEILGVKGALRLWFHGMAMFFVSTVGMAGVFWVIQEYLAQFAFIYGIVQALVISVSVRQSVIFGGDEEELKSEDEGKESEGVKDTKENKERIMSAKDKVKTS